MKTIIPLILLALILSAVLSAIVFISNRDPVPELIPDPQLPQPAGFGLAQYVRAGVIVIGYASSPTAKVQRPYDIAAQMAVNVHEMIRSAKLTFAEAAEKHSDAPSASQGGDIGFVNREQISQMEGAAVLFHMKSGEVSHVIEGTIGFYIYKRIPYEPAFFKIIAIRYQNDTENSPRTADEARKLILKIQADLKNGSLTFDEAAAQYSDIAAGPGGYIGEVIPGTKSPPFENAAFRLKQGERSAIIDDGSVFMIAQRCDPQQYTFSYIAFSGTETDLEALKAKAESALELINNNPQHFYSFAVSHYTNINWDAPWYRISKDAYTHQLAPAVLTFLQQSAVGAISKPLEFNNGVYLLIKEEFIPPH